MHRSQLATVLAVGLLFACPDGSGEDRSASSQQRYTIHIPQKVKFWLAEPPAFGAPVTLPANENAESLVFSAETTSGTTILFETEGEPSRKLSLKLTVGGTQQESWWANEVNGAAALTHGSVAEGTSVQASTLGAGWTTLTIGTISPATMSDETITTIVVTIVPH